MDRQASQEDRLRGKQRNLGDRFQRSKAVHLRRAVRGKRTLAGFVRGRALMLVWIGGPMWIAASAAEAQQVATEEPQAQNEPPPAAAERLRPRVGDSKLWVVPRLSGRTLRTLSEAREMLRATIAARSDSLATAEARYTPPREWSLGKEGNRWSVSPGGFHLGPVALPVPFEVGSSAGGTAPVVSRRCSRADVVSQWCVGGGE